ncbi:nuclease-related domain-containing protein [Pontibacillus sp. HMF3514]|uniref:nuclease-related domain-containing protein n=1 Tax=Pontibacillus sp. HMF3514 TaxID=2692425 RepID=UPI00131F5424|nr:nuclease-related domain-containing protein [Pontibacillus sp. HMF3514]QHE53582.1 hypothetical protein GS400_16860 [Pontibacillus sp. HMF3514]
MNAKKRIVPLIILQLEALLRRLSLLHPKRKQIEDDLGIMWSGYNGEVLLDYDLRFLPYRSYQILHDVRLQVFGKCFQIDTLVLSPYAAFIVEAKNYAGTIFFDEESETFIQLVRGKKKTMKDPLIQVTRQQKQLEEWLRHNAGIHSYPVIPMVAICNPSTIVTPPKNHSQIWPIMNSIHTVDQIQKNNDLYKNRKPVDIELIKNKIISADTPLEQDLLKKYSINPSDVKLGVYCPGCGNLPMNYIRRRWECSECGYRSSIAHIKALADYFLLFKNTITNRECRILLGCSERSAYHFLVKLGLRYSGDTSARKYHAPENMRDFLSFVKSSK